MPDKDDLRVTIRLLPEKRQVYEDYRDMVINRLHSDVCYVTTMLMESFTQAVDSTPDSSKPVILSFLKQNIQINMGCNFNYFTKKARRNLKDVPESAKIEKNHVFPNVVEQFPNLKQESREFWLELFRAEGLIKDPVSTGKLEGIYKKILALWKHCMTFVTGLLGLMK